ncbi:hypothetical protein PIB30_086299 [Stylosanthes scabra]|uniref:Uncharacterized protein n=1 Tax=Stylosanthes scabra TaxID=79078 RepID=A0ABU6QTM1_9FABA|nr:hypothetical protein [Stylosanthes scabra]
MLKESPVVKNQLQEVCLALQGLLTRRLMDCSDNEAKGNMHGKIMEFMAGLFRNSRNIVNFSKSIVDFSQWNTSYIQKACQVTLPDMSHQFGAYPG